METFTTVSLQYCLNAGYLGLYNRQQVGVTPFFRTAAATTAAKAAVAAGVIQPTTGWDYTTDNRLGLHLFQYRRRHCRRLGGGGGGTEKKFSSSCVQCLHAYHTVVNVSTHITSVDISMLTTWRSMSAYISHSGKCLHAYHMTVNVYTHITLCQMSPYISHSGKCLHACHMV